MSTARPSRGNVVPLGLGVALADPVSIWPSTTVIEVVPDVARLLMESPEQTVRAAIAAQAGVDIGDVEVAAVTTTAAGGALVRLDSETSAARALSVAARRRGTSPAEALHAAILAVG